MCGQNVDPCYLAIWSRSGVAKASGIAHNVVMGSVSRLLALCGGRDVWFMWVCIVISHVASSGCVQSVVAILGVVLILLLYFFSLWMVYWYACYVYSRYTNGYGPSIALSALSYSFLSFQVNYGKQFDHAYLYQNI
jgi:hypothetical protein